MWIFDVVSTLESDGSLLVLLGLTGIVISAVGLVRDRPGSVVLDDVMRFKYATWGVPPELVGDIEHYRRWLFRFTLLATGLALLLEGVALAAGTRLGLVHLQASRSWPTDWLALLVLPQVAGTAAGYVAAASAGRGRRLAGPRYADLRERRLTDYRTPTLRWAGLALVAVPVAAALPIALQHATWVPLLLPAAMVLFVCVAEGLLVVSARVPRMVVTAEPAMARRCDDLLRAQVITSIQMLAFLGVGLGGFVQWAMVGGPAGWVTLAGAALAVLMALVTVANDCRLGGRINGWPGKPMPG